MALDVRATEDMIFHKLLPLMVVPLEDWYNDVTIFSVRTSLRKCAFPLRPRRNQTIVQFPTIYSPFNQNLEPSTENTCISASGGAGDKVSNPKVIFFKAADPLVS